MDPALIIVTRVDQPELHLGRFFQIRPTGPICTPTDEHAIGCQCERSFWLSPKEETFQEWNQLVRSPYPNGSLRTYQLHYQGAPFQITQASYQDQTLSIISEQVAFSCTLDRAMGPVFGLDFPGIIKVILYLGEKPNALVLLWYVPGGDQTLIARAITPAQNQILIDQFYQLVRMAIAYPLPPNILVLLQPNVVEGLFLHPACTTELAIATIQNHLASVP